LNDSKEIGTIFCGRTDKNEKEEREKERKREREKERKRG
jgi:hypothetical protein